MRVNFSFFNSLLHTVEIAEFYCHGFFARIPSNQCSTKEVYFKMIRRKIIAWHGSAVNFSFFHTVCYKVVDKNSVKSTFYQSLILRYILQIAQCAQTGNLLSYMYFFDKNFVKKTFLLCNKITK